MLLAGTSDQESLLPTTKTYHQDLHGGCCRLYLLTLFLLDPRWPICAVPHCVSLQMKLKWTSWEAFQNTKTSEFPLPVLFFFHSNHDPRKFCLWCCAFLGERCNVIKVGLFILPLPCIFYIHIQLCGWCRWLTQAYSQFHQDVLICVSLLVKIYAMGSKASYFTLLLRSSFLICNGDILLCIL